MLTRARQLRPALQVLDGDPYPEAREASLRALEPVGGPTSLPGWSPSAARAPSLS